jgi:hypothetical protein
MLRQKVAITCLNSISCKETALFAIIVITKAGVSLQELDFKHMMMAILGRNL